MSRIRTYIRYMLWMPVYWISCVIPKDKNLWIFGAWFGQRFADNSKYLFLYVQQEHPEIRPVWLAHNPRVVSELREMDYEAYMAYSIKGCLLSMRAGAVVISSGLGDVNRYAIGQAEKIQLWHGTPLKKIGSDDVLRRARNGTGVRALLKKVKDRLFPFAANRFAFVIAASVQARLKLASAFKMSESRVRVAGYPRNDALVSSGYASTEIERLQGKVKGYLIDKTVIAYLPTFRDTREVDLLADYEFVESNVQAFLKRRRAVLWIKGHFADQSLQSVGDTGASRIFTLSDKQLPDIYPLLRETDILITDYSSVFFDYLLLDRPIIFAPFDLEDYVRRDRELYYDYDAVTPGPKARNWPEVLQLIEETMKKDDWKERREQICRRFNKFNDGESSKRVFEEVHKLLKSRYMGKHG